MKKLAILVILSIPVLYASAQEKSLLAGLEDGNKSTEKVTGAFKSTRVINAHSIEMLGKGNLDVRILHRFGMINQGVKQLFGLDNASMRMGLDYGITNNLMVGLGRSTYRKELDGFVKYRILQQSKGYKAMPVSVIAVLGATVWTEPSFDSIKPGLGDRSSYYLQLLIGKKITTGFSLQFSPILLASSNLANLSNYNHAYVALGGGGRLKFTKRMALTFDYHHVLGKLDPGFRAPLSLGVDIETGGHVFQLHFTNAVGMNERAYIAQTTGGFFKGDIRFGFNLSRLFKLGKKKSSL